MTSGTARGCTCKRCQYYRKQARESARRRKLGQLTMEEYRARQAAEGGVVRSSAPEEPSGELYVRDRLGNRRKVLPPVPHKWRKIGIVAPP